MGLRRLCRLNGLGFVRRRRGRGSLSGTIAWRGTNALNLYAGDALAVHLDNREAMVSVLKTFAAARNEAELIENEAADGGVCRIFRKRDAVLGVEVAHIQSRIENDSAIGKGKGVLDDVKFVVNLSHDLLEDILQGNEAQNAAKFIDDDGQADVTRAQLQKQFARGLGLWDDEHLAQHAAQIERRRGEIAERFSSRRRSRSRRTHSMSLMCTKPRI